MSDSITLSPKHGVNATVVKCIYCDEDYGIALLGNAHQYECSCSQVILGTRKGSCPRCGVAARSWKDLGDFDGMGTALRQGACTRCEEELKAGAILFKCRCGSSGLIRHTAPLCADVRTKMNIPAPTPCGVEIDSCPHCEVA